MSRSLKRVFLYLFFLAFFGVIFVITPLIVLANDGPVAEKVIEATATTYAYLPIIFQGVIATGSAALAQPMQVAESYTVAGFLGTGLLLGVGAVLLPYMQDEAGQEEIE